MYIQEFRAFTVTVCLLAGNADALYALHTSFIPGELASSTLTYCHMIAGAVRPHPSHSVGPDILRSW